MLRIFIADDSKFVRQGINTLLSDRDDWVICGEAEDGEECVRKAIKLRPDLLLVDVHMPGLSGYNVATVLRRELPRTKILMMSAEESGIFLAGALRAGADKCIDKSRLGIDLLPIILGYLRSQAA